MQPAVFLDRDNTLIANDGDLGNPAAVKLVDGVAVGLRHLREAGYRLVVVTNQAGVARGKFSEEDVDSVHQRIATLIDEQAGVRNGSAAAAGLIDRFYYCPYHPEASVSEYRRDHPWRKPHPGMILQAARDMGLDLSRSWMVGDQERDILAGRAAGCRTILFSRDAELAQRIKPMNVAATFSDAVKAILQHKSPAPHSPASTTATGPGVASPAAAPHAAPHPIPQPHPAPHRAAHPPADGEIAGVRRAVQELTEEIRADRLRRGEFRLMTMLAALCQLLALTLGLLGLLQMENFEHFAKWMLGAALTQMLTLTLVVLDSRA